MRQVSTYSFALPINYQNVVQAWYLHWVLWQKFVYTISQRRQCLFRNDSFEIIWLQNVAKIPYIGTYHYIPDMDLYRYFLGIRNNSHSKLRISNSNQFRCKVLNNSTTFRMPRASVLWSLYQNLNQHGLFSIPKILRTKKYIC